MFRPSAVTTMPTMIANVSVNKSLTAKHFMLQHDTGHKASQELAATGLTKHMHLASRKTRAMPA